MPQCQRSYFYLSDDPAAPDEWVCPGWPKTAVGDACPGNERYTVLHERRWAEHAESARSHCEALFGAADRPTDTTMLIRGITAQTIHEKGAARFVIYVVNGSDDDQLRGQLAHEAFHRVRSWRHDRATLHWVHEMLATLFTVTHLREHGYGAYAAKQVARFRAEAPLLTTAGFTRVTSLPYPAAVYARGYVLGESLVEAVGWQRLAGLASTFDAAGVPDVSMWLGKLPRQLRRAAERALAAA